MEIDFVPVTRINFLYKDKIPSWNFWGEYTPYFPVTNDPIINRLFKDAFIRVLVNEYYLNVHLHPANEKDFCDFKFI